MKRKRCGGGPGFSKKKTITNKMMKQKLCGGDPGSSKQKLVSEDAFKYSYISHSQSDGTIEQNQDHINRLTEIIHSRDFDINVTNNRPDSDGHSILWTLLNNKHSYPMLKPLIEFLLKQPTITVSDDLVIDLNERQHNQAIDLIRKYKKIPKHLKWMLN
jgi:hypothetical protein